MFESGGYNQVDNFSVKYRYQGLYRPNVWISRAADDFRMCCDFGTFCCGRHDRNVFCAARAVEACDLTIVSSLVLVACEPFHTSCDVC